VLVCAAQTPERLADVGLVSGFGPLDAPGATDGLALVSRFGFKTVPLPFVLWPFLWMFIQPIRVPPGHQDIQKGVRQGPRGSLHEHRLQVRPWGFELGSIPVHIDLWHGEQHKPTPISMAEYMAEQLPSGPLYTYPRRDTSRPKITTRRPSRHSAPSDASSLCLQHAVRVTTVEFRQICWTKKPACSRRSLAGQTSGTSPPNCSMSSGTTSNRSPTTP
jgi:hypothetical protein